MDREMLGLYHIELKFSSIATYKMAAFTKSKSGGDIDARGNYPSRR